MQAVNLEEFFWESREYALENILDVKKSGRKIVGIYCTYCPQELIIATGAIPVSLCGTRNDTVGAAEKILPHNLCPLIKSSYGFAVTDTCPFFAHSDLIIGETTCDGKKKMFEIMQEIKPVYVMNLPHLKSGSNILKIWTEEITKLKKHLEEIFNIEITVAGMSHL